MSWLAAARKRVLDRFASSASAFAAESASFRRVSSSVRSQTRLLQNLVQPFPRFLLRHRLGDVGVGGDEAAVGQAVRADLDDPLRRVDANPHRLRVPGERAQAGRDQARPRSPGRRCPRSALKRIKRVEGHADAHQVGGEIVEVDEGPVPAQEVALLVEHGDALAGMVEGVLEEVAVVLERRRGVVEKLERLLGRDVAAAEQEREREAGRGGADGRGEQVLGVAEQVNVGLGPPVERLSPAPGEAREGLAGALLAEVARDRRSQVLDRDAGAEKAEGRRDRRVVHVHEGLGLQALDGAGRTQKRHGT